MSLPVPVVGEESSPQWAIDLNACLAIIDAHNHTSGNGQPITPGGLNINADLPFANNNLTGVRSVRLQTQSAPLAVITDLGCLYESGVDLYYNDGSGNQVRITQSGAVAGSPGSIANLASPATATYVSANSTFVWQSDANTPANSDGASVILRNLTANSKGLTLSPPNAMGADYALVLPALPVATRIMTLDASGNIGASVNVDSVSLQLSANVLSIKDDGVTTAKILNSNVTTAKIADGAITPAKKAALGQQVSGNSGNASTGNTSYTDVVPLTVTITTTGRPVFIGLQGNGVNETCYIGCTGTGYIRTKRNGTGTVINSISGVTQMPSSAYSFVDVVAAGTYTYQIDIRVDTGSISVFNSALVAYEL